MADPAVICLVGDSGTGKTVENVYSWAGRGLFLAQPGALRVAETVCGIELGDRVQEAQRIEHVRQWIFWAAENGFEAVVVDDASLLMKNTMTLAKPAFALVKNGEVKGYDRGMWQYFKDEMTNLTLAARWARIQVILNWHPQESMTVSAKDEKTGIVRAELLPAGPDAGWAKLVKEFPHAADVLLWSLGRQPGMPAWDTRAWNDPAEKMKLSKDRFDVAVGTNVPLNTAELLRAAGFPVTRPPGMEWMEEAAEDIAQRMVAGTPQQDATGAWKAHIGDKVHPYHLRWALRDGAHRGQFRLLKKSSVLEGF